MDLGLTGKVAIVTGGSRGVGRAIAASLLREGARVTIAARDPQRLESARKALEQETKGEVRATAAELGRDGDARALIDATVKAFGHLDILVNNGAAGGGGRRGHVPRFGAVELRDRRRVARGRRGGAQHLRDEGRCTGDKQRIGVYSSSLIPHPSVAMSIAICPVTPSFAAEVGDVDLSQPLADADFAAIAAAFWKYAVLVFPGQDLTPDQHLAFASRFGPVETDRVLEKKVTPQRLDDSFADISNLAPDGKIWTADSRQRMYKAGNKLWHTDSSFKFRPGLCSLLYSRTVAPVGGHTEFADQRAAYDALPDAMKKKLQGLVAEHSIATSRRKSGFTDFTADEGRRLPPVPQVLVRTIPQNGRKSLYVASHAGRVFGMPENEGRVLIDELIAHTTQRQFVYTHRWRPHDLVMWDNRCTMHRGTDYEDLRWVRDMQRATVSDVANSCLQEGVPVPA